MQLSQLSSFSYIRRSIPAIRSIQRSVADYSLFVGIATIKTEQLAGNQFHFFAFVVKNGEVRLHDSRFANRKQSF